MISTKCFSSIQFVFLRKLVMQHCTNVTSFCMQFEKRGSWLVWEAFRSKGESFVGWKHGGQRESISPENILFPLLAFSQQTTLTLESFPQLSTSSFSNCMENDVTSVCRSWTSFRKKQLYTTASILHWNEHYLAWSKWCVHFGRSRKVSWTAHRGFSLGLNW